MAVIGQQLDASNFDPTWTPACMVAEGSQHKLYGQAEYLFGVDCEFLAESLAPLLIGTIHPIDCSESFIKAVYQKPKFYSTPPIKSSMCGTNRPCGNAVAEAGDDEFFQYTVEEVSLPMPKDVCGTGGCGSHPEAASMLSIQNLISQQEKQLNDVINARFMKYIYEPLKANLAVADASYPTIEKTSPLGTFDVVDYVAINNDPINSITSVLADAALALGYDDAIQPATMDETDFANNCVCCKDGAGLVRMFNILQDEVDDMFMSVGNSFVVIANKKDIPSTLLMDLRMNYRMQTTLAAPLAEAGVMPNSVISKHQVYDIAGNKLIISYAAPQGTMLVMPEETRKYIQFAMSPVKTQVNAPSGCDRTGYHIAEKAFGWYIPECYRSKYILIDVSAMEECCKLTPCVQEGN